MEPSSIIELAKNGDIEQLKERFLSDVGLDVQDEDYGQTAISWASENGHLEVVTLLLEHGAKINIADDGGRLPLYWACRNNHMEIARVLLAKMTEPQDILRHDDNGRSALSIAAMCGAAGEITRFLATPDIDINSQDDEQWTPLMFAAAKGHEEATKVLLDSNADQSLKDNEDRTALYHASENGHLKAMELLISPDSDIDARDVSGRSPLIWASIHGVVPTVELLLEKGADPNLRDHRWQQNSLMYAAENGHDNVVELLCDRSTIDIDATATDWRDQTALIFAVQSGKLASVKALLKHSPDLGKVDSEYGRSPLSWAAECENIDVPKLLIQAGADLYSTDHSGQSPVDFAARNSPDLLKACIEEPGPNDSTTEPLPRARAIELGLRYACKSEDHVIRHFILESDTYLNSQDKDHRNIVSLAAEHGNKAEMEKLCEKNLDFNLKDDTGRKPLSWAAAGGHHEVLKIIVGRSTHIDFKDKSGRTALSRAAENGNKEAVSVLQEHGAHPDKVDANKRTPLSWAASRGHLSVTEYLLNIRWRKEKGPPVEAKDGSRVTQEPPSGKVSREAREAARSTTATTRKKAHTAEVDCTVNVDSRDSDYWTPLFHAVCKGHKEVVQTLLAHGANPGLTARGITGSLNVTLAELFKETSGQRSTPDDAIRKILDSYGSLRTEPLKRTEGVDEEFKATVVKISKEGNYSTSPGTLSVSSLLQREPPLKQLADDDSSCRWLHLPANNVNSS